GRVFTRAELIGTAWKENVHVGPRTVDVHIGKLRRALKAKSEADLIRTVRSVGYAMTDEPGNSDDRDK
ncbi:MAG: winged helix-turn-helix domain-containing protein, partial [Hyphomicrobium sp.]